MYCQLADWVHNSRRLLATAAVGVLGLMLGFHIAFGQNGMISYMHKREESRKLQQQIKSLKTDPKTIEREAREQLRYARPGEVIYTLPAPSNNNVPVQAKK
jgi:cell division protein FtsB